jgi:hypothetical protein
MEAATGAASTRPHASSVSTVSLSTTGTAADNKVSSAWLTLCMGGRAGLSDEGAAEGTGVEDMAGLTEKIEVRDKGEALFSGRYSDPTF